MNKIELRRLNRNIIYRNLLNKDEISKQELAIATGMSIPTVAQNLDDLVKAGLVETVGALESTGGRRAIGYKCKKNARYAIGIDITQNHITIAVVNLACEIVCISDREVFKFADNPACYKEISEKTEKLLKENKIKEKSVLGIGVALPCIIDKTGEKVIYSKVIDAPEDVQQKLQKYFKLKVVVYNDANAAGYAEMTKRDAGPSKSRILFYILLSNSVGGALIKREGSELSMYLGDHCRGGEVGHMRIEPDGRECYCGQKGCVNEYCSAKILSDNTDGKLEKFFEELSGGNKKYEAIMDEYLKYLAITVVNLRMIHDCEIVLGGYVGAYMDEYIGKLRDLVSILNPFEEDSLFLTPCRFKHDASAVGAAFNFIGRFIEEV
ncbi:MAG: ROK family transcriptional regulator [Eubacterium sp.]|nr:ROK family transcriptional regulator [Eubacterium sp.]